MEPVAGARAGPGGTRREVYAMHDVNPDLVGIKTAVRQMASRLEQEAQAAKQWASLSKNRGVSEVGSRLEKVASLLEEALADAREVPPLLFEAQEQGASDAHSHD